MNLTEQDKIEVCARGLEFEQLKKNPAMQILLDELQHRAELAREELCLVDPANEGHVSKLQREVAKFRELMGIINGFISEGQMMEDQLDDEAQLTE